MSLTIVTLLILPLLELMYYTFTMIVLSYWHYIILYSSVSFFNSQLFPGILDCFLAFQIVSIMMYIILNILLAILHHFSFCYFYFLVTSWHFWPISEPFWYDIYCSKQFSGHFTLFYINSTFISWLFWGISYLFLAFPIFLL